MNILSNATTVDKRFGVPISEFNDLFREVHGMARAAMQSESRDGDPESKPTDETQQQTGGVE